jgi:hypothetical protein
VAGQHGGGGLLFAEVRIQFSSESLLRAWSTWIMKEKRSKTPYPPDFFSWAVLGLRLSVGRWLVLAVVSV